MTMRIGFGYDVHAFAPDRQLILGGVTIPFELGLDGHSDADTVIHAVVDALLGAAALGDIGTHFPSSDVRWKDQPSSVFLDYTSDLLRQHGWTISNIDATIVAERPKLSQYIPAMRYPLCRSPATCPRSSQCESNYHRWPRLCRTPGRHRLLRRGINREVEPDTHKGCHYISTSLKCSDIPCGCQAPGVRQKRMSLTFY